MHIMLQLILEERCGVVDKGDNGRNGKREGASCFRLFEHMYNRKKSYLKSNPLFLPRGLYVLSFKHCPFKMTSRQYDGVSLSFILLQMTRALGIYMV